MTIKLTRAKSFIYNLVSDDASCSLLSRAESVAIKGFLILLIVLGHDKILMGGGYCNKFLYSFHIYDFFFLPFLYDFRREKLSRFVIKNLRRFYVPFTFFFLIVAILSIRSGFTPAWTTVCYTYLQGGQHLMGETFGMGSFVWFIPTMFSLLFIRQIYYRASLVGRCTMLILSLLALLGYAYMWSPCVWMWWYLPLNFYVASAMLFPAVVARTLFQSENPQAVTAAFMGVIIATFIIYPSTDIYAYLTLNRLINPVLMLLLLLSFRSFLCRSRLIARLGDLSFQIYLIHIFLYYGAYIIIERFNLSGLTIGFTLFVVVLIVAYWIAKIPLWRYVFLK